MKLIIDIPQERYERIDYVDSLTLKEIVKNGTPLDKLKEKIGFEMLKYSSSAGYYRVITKVLQIIDNYRAESEDKE